MKKQRIFITAVLLLAALWGLPRRAAAQIFAVRADVDTGKFPLYFLKIFDPDLTESSADFEEHFKVDSQIGRAHV